MRHTLVLILAMCTTLPAALAAQWRLGLEIGAARFEGVTRALSTGDPVFRPSPHTTIGIALTRGGDQFRLGIGLRRSTYGLSTSGGEDGQHLDIIFGDAMQSVGLRSTAAVRVASLTPTTHLWSELGTVFELWSVTGEDRARPRAGPVGAVGIEFSLGRRLVGTLKGEISVTASPLESSDLDAIATRATAWRRGLYGGVVVRL